MTTSIKKLFDDRRMWVGIGGVFSSIEYIDGLEIAGKVYHGQISVTSKHDSKRLGAWAATIYLVTEGQALSRQAYGDTGTAALDALEILVNEMVSEMEVEIGPFLIPVEPEITDAGKCSACGAEIDIELIKHYDYKVDRSGVQPGTPNGPAVYWSEGTIACPGCGVRLDYSESSD